MSIQYGHGDTIQYITETQPHLIEHLGTLSSIMLWKKRHWPDDHLVTTIPNTVPPEYIILSQSSTSDFIIGTGRIYWKISYMDIDLFTEFYPEVIKIPLLKWWILTNNSDNDLVNCHTGDTIKKYVYLRS